MGNHRSSATIKHKDFKIRINIVKMYWGEGALFVCMFVFTVVIVFEYAWCMYCVFIYVIIYFDIYIYVLRLS